MNTIRQSQATFLVALVSIGATWGCGPKCPADAPEAGNQAVAAAAVVLPTPTVLKNYSPLRACTSTATCTETPVPVCASTTTSCVSTYDGTTSKFCSFTPKGITATSTCPCFAGEREYCYIVDASGNWIQGSKTCAVNTTEGTSVWSTCTAL